MIASCFSALFTVCSHFRQQSVIAAVYTCCVKRNTADSALRAKEHPEQFRKGGGEMKRQKVLGIRKDYLVSRLQSQIDALQEVVLNKEHSRHRTAECLREVMDKIEKNVLNLDH